MKQNITLAIDKPLLKRARSIAAQRGTSISALLARSSEGWWTGRRHTFRQGRKPWLT